jgi:beta-galactosidase
MEEYFADNPDKPFLMCEYGHAMGNGPGDLEDYWQVIQAHDGFCGGFIWEWCDHAVYKGQAENGKAMYYYGGDHGEFPHDKNFCVDGMVYPDRTPSTGLWEYWNVHRPARVTRYENGALTLHNYLDFTALDQALTATYELRTDGKLMGSGSLAVPAIPPHGEGSISLPLALPAGKATLKVLYYSTQDHPLCPAGHLLGFDDIALGGQCTPATQLWKLQASGAPAWTEDERYITVSGQQFTYKLDKRTGLWATMEYMGKPLMEKPMELNIWRAPTDNDRKIRLVWADAGYDRAVIRNYTTETTNDADGLHIHCVSAISAVYLQRILNIRTQWSVDALGNITAAVHGEKDPVFPELPRFGLRLFLPQDMEQVGYLGIGPMESYCDKHHAGWYADFSTTVTDLHEDYIKPQENGSHWGCDLLRLESTGEDGLTLRVVSDRPFSFNASHYTQEALTQTPHNFELEHSGMTVLCLDGFQAGIGSNSCGPVLQKKYQVAQTTLDFTFRLLPGTK